MHDAFKKLNVSRMYQGSLAKETYMLYKNKAFSIIMKMDVSQYK